MIERRRQNLILYAVGYVIKLLSRIARKAAIQNIFMNANYID